MDEKLRFIALAISEEQSMTDLCRAFGISRKTGYKWLERYRLDGAAGLAERSHARIFQERKVTQNVIDLILEERRCRPTWGPRKLVALLAARWPKLHFPAHSTVAEILKAHGLSKARRRRPRTPAFSGSLALADRPNAVWCADYKGDFALGDRKRCYPLTITDQHSRYLIRCEALLRTDFTAARVVFGRAFVEYGMPEVVRTDNGTPFASSAPGGISRLSVWLIKLGVRPERIAKGKPTQNGRHERMHRTLKSDAIRPPQPNRLLQQRKFDKFRSDFNLVRPHEALGQRPPASIYERSAREFPGALCDPEYPKDFECVRVRGDGVLKWLGQRAMISELLGGELVGLADREDGGWDVHFGPVLVGKLDRNAVFRGAR